jgi:hypothetical protein
MSYSFYNPLFMFVYDNMSGTAISNRIIEIAFDNFSFRLVSFITLCATLLPIFFYNCA